MRDLGTAGEDEVRKWCSLSGITASPPSRDRYGWDLFFEMPSSHDPASAQGLHEARIECKVQIKSTDVGKWSQPIELSNLHYMATSSLPTFYLLLAFSHGDNPVAASLIHLDEERCKKILSRVRRETAKKKPKNLNDITQSLNFKEGVKILPVNGEGLKKAICDCIGVSQSAYVVKKQEMLKVIGFEEGAYQFKFDVNKLDAQKFVEMTLGTAGDIKVTNVRSFLTRFGITEENPQLSSDAAIISILDVESDSKGKAIFRNKDTGANIEYEVDIYSGGLGFWAPEQHKTLRLKTEVFTIDVYVNRASFRIWFHLEDNIPYSVRLLSKNSRLLQLLTDPRAVELSLFSDQPLFKGKLKGKGLSGDFKSAIRVTDALFDIQRSFDHYDEIFVSPAELVSIARGVIGFSNFLKLNDDELDASVKFTLVEPGVVLSQAECIVPVSVTVGAVSFVVLYVFGGVLTHLGKDKYSLCARWRKVLYKTHFSIPVGKDSLEISEIKRVAESYTGDSAVVNLTDKYITPILERSRQLLGSISEIKD